MYFSPNTISFITNSSSSLVHWVQMPVGVKALRAFWVSGSLCFLAPVCNKGTWWVLFESGFCGCLAVAALTWGWALLYSQHFPLQVTCAAASNIMGGVGALLSQAAPGTDSGGPVSLLIKSRFVHLCMCLYNSRIDYFVLYYIQKFCIIPIPCSFQLNLQICWQWVYDKKT